MHLIRRAALRGLRSQPAPISSSARSSPLSSRFVKCQQSQVSWAQTRLYSDAIEKTNASPAEKEGGQTEQKEIKQESIGSESINSQVDAMEAIKEKVTDAAETVASTVRSTTRSWRSSGREREGPTPRSERRAERWERRPVSTEPSKIVYVGNLYFDLSPERLRQKFAEIGNITNVKVVTDSSGMSKGFGYVEFDSIDSATEAIKQLDGEHLEGRRMTVQYHIRRIRTPPAGNRNPASRTLFIGNMSFQMSDKDLHDLFRNVKNVMDVRVAIDRRSGQPRGFAHADFTDVESAQEAKTFLESKVVHGRQLRIDYGVPSEVAKPRDQE